MENEGKQHELPTTIDRPIPNKGSDGERHIAPASLKSDSSF
jgi:hypothetical protein